MNTFHRFTSARCILAIVAWVVCAPALGQAIYSVDSTADMVDDNPGNGICHAANGHCTLRAATMEANRSSDGSLIDLPAGIYTLTLPNSASDDDTGGDLKLTPSATNTSQIEIAGAGSATTVIEAPVDTAFSRLVRVGSKRLVLISGLTLRGGIEDYGGAIHNDGTLTLSRVHIGPQNRAYVCGGAIANDGVLTLDHVEVGPQNSAKFGGGVCNESNQISIADSSIVGNTASSYGGGIYNTGDAFVSTSTIASNTSINGAGIYAGGNTKVVNSTIALNQATLAGGGIYANLSVPVLIHSSTIVDNAAYSQDPGYGGGIYLNALHLGSVADVTLRNSLLARNRDYGGQGDFEDCYTMESSVLKTFGGNVLSTLNGCNTSDSVTLLNSLDDLGSLKNNGGPTQTIALLAGSNAIDAGNICFDTSGTTLLTDQRGFARLVGNRCDAGAYEFDPDRIFTNGFDE